MLRGSTSLNTARHSGHCAPVCCTREKQSRQPLCPDVSGTEEIYNSISNILLSASIASFVLCYCCSDGK